MVALGERSRIGNLNWPLVLVVITIAAVGVVNLVSASKSRDPDLWASQIVWLGLGVAVAGAVALADYRWLERAAWPLYGVTLLCLGAVLVVGTSAKGAQRWLELGPLRFQPSELAKIAIIVTLARFFHEDANEKGYDLVQLVRPFAVLLIPVGLIAVQPDLGTAMATAAIGFSMCLFARIRWKTLVALATGGLALAYVGWRWALHDYQRQRLVSFLDPASNARGAAHQSIQSVIAVGSGGVSGKGWGEGTQHVLKLLPEPHTDFAFAVFGEEHGFIWSAGVVLLFVLLVALAFSIGANARDRFGAFLAVGVGALFFWHAFINIGMVTGMLPVVGVPLPLFSYGGSSVIVNMIGIGILLNVSLRRYMF
jgi:rod shape determining protein RodA